MDTKELKLTNIDRLNDLYEEEDLHPDLKDHISKDGKLGWETLKHPLVFSVPYFPALNKQLNRQYLFKTERCNKCLKDGGKQNYSTYIWMHERPYRFMAFCQIKDFLSNRDYWELFASVWTDSENIWQNQQYIFRIIMEDRPDKHFMMNIKETELLNSFPEEIRVYRGHHEINRFGYSWTLSYWKAKWFAERFDYKHRGVVSGTVNKNDIIAVLLGRNESEIVIDPETISDIRPFTLRHTHSELREIAKSQFKLEKHSYHGPTHWAKVEYNALKIAEINGADKKICKLFAMFHDCKRANEDHDEDHGERASAFLKELFDNKKLDITADQFEKLKYACDFHEKGKITDDTTIGTCWDADRLDLIRVGIAPDKKLLSTEAGRNLLWTI